MTSAYLQLQLKELKRTVGSYPRADREFALEAFKNGLEAELHTNYPKRFPNVPEPVVNPSFYPTRELGANIARNLGPLECEGTYEFLVKEIEGNKTRLSQTRTQRTISTLKEIFKVGGRR